MKQIFLAIILPVVLGGCFKRVDDFTTPGDYERAFQVKQKISLQNKTLLNLSDARELALANNPTLRSAAAAIRSAQYTYFRSLSAWSPEVTAYGEVNHALAAGHGTIRQGIQRTLFMRNGFRDPRFAVLGK